MISNLEDSVTITRLVSLHTLNLLGSSDQGKQQRITLDGKHGTKNMPQMILHGRHGPKELPQTITDGSHGTPKPPHHATLNIEM